MVFWLLHRVKRIHRRLGLHRERIEGWNEYSGRDVLMKFIPYPELVPRKQSDRAAIGELGDV